MSEPRSAPATPVPLIAVVAAGCLMPGATTLSGYWQNILAKKDLLTDIPRTHWHPEDYYDADPKRPDHTYARRGAFLPEVAFDTLGFGIPPSLLPATDTSQLLALIVAQAVLDDLAPAAKLDRNRTSVILGVTGAQELLGSLVARLQRPVWERGMRQVGLPEDEVQAACDKIAAHYVPWQEASFPGLLGNVVAGRIANRLDLGGSNYVTDAACASALTAIHAAILELAYGDSDVVLTGGVDTMNDIFMYMCFSKTPALSPTGDCRPFADDADGTMLGEGIGMVALKRLADAERDGDHIYGVIRGVGTSSDGRSKSVYAPVSEGQAKALRRAYEHAGYGPETVELVEAHGTATKAGDTAELNGLKLVFDPTRSDRQWCALGSVKSQIGHTKAAAGIAGFLKVILALHHKVIPPTIKVKRPNQYGDFENSAFYLATEPRPWIRTPDHPRRASVSSFGFGGSNFHVACEEYTGAAPRPGRSDLWPTELLVYTAADDAGLITALEASRSEAPEAIARRTQTSWDAKAKRRITVLVNADGSDLTTLLDKAIAAVRKGTAVTRGNIWFTPDAVPGKVAFLFPGQGSQYLEMGRSLAMTLDPARLAWDAADAAFEAEDRLSFVTFPRPVFDTAARTAQEAHLVRTEWAQPAIGAASAASLAVLRSLGVVPDVAGGHSFGELTALYCAGVLTLTDLVRAARKRGELMAAAAARPGAMVAVVAGPEAVTPHLGADVVIANYNTPEQTVIAGETHAVEAAQARLEGAGLRCTRLSVATAFHSSLVAPAGEQFSTWLAHLRFEPAEIPVYSNATAAPHGDEGLADALGSHLRSPVRFVEELAAMHAAGVRTFIEVGPGSVLTGLVSRCLPGKDVYAVPTDAKSRDALSSLMGALGHLAALGLPVDFAPLWVQRALPAVKPAPKAAVNLTGANHGKPWPRVDQVEVHTNPPRAQFPVQPLALPVAPAPAAPRAPAPGSPPMAEPPRPIAPPQAVAPVATPAVSPAARADVVAAPAAALAAASEETPVPEPLNPWLTAFLDHQSQASQTHEHFQRALTDAHIAWLHTHEEVTRGLLGLLGAPVTLAAAHPQAASTSSASSPARAAQLTPMAAPIVAPVRAVTKAPTTVVASPPVAIPVATPVAPKVAAPPSPAARRSSISAPTPPPGPASPVLPDATALLLAVVAEKTGYPAEMLNLDLSLEADLGIDSIKRVEILSTLRERAPSLPEVGAEQLGTLHTLGEIVAALGAVTGVASTPTHPTTQVTHGPPAAASPAAFGIDATALLLAVVAEKTGYPAEMLNLDLSLEADLGIDSIKRVEILSTLRERAPSLPEVGAEQLGTLHTLGEIVAALGAVTGAAPLTHGTPSAVASSAPDALHRLELTESLTPAGATRVLGPLAVVGSMALAAALAQGLIIQGIDARPATVEELDGSRGVLFLGALDTTRTAPDVMTDLLRAAQRSSLSASGAFVVVYTTPGSREEALLAGLRGFARTVALEHPAAHVRAIELPLGVHGDVATLLAAELPQVGPMDVRLDGAGGRWHARSVDMTGGHNPLPYGPEDVIVFTGGARGVTAACALALATAVRPRLVLLGRSHIDVAEPIGAGLDEASIKRALHATERGLTPAELGRRATAILHAREARANIAALTGAGSEVRYLPLDVTDRNAVDAALAEVRAAWGPITGIVHGAGVIHDRKLVDKTPDQLLAVWDTKVNGALALLDATAADPLRLVCFFSSVAARFGNIGQCDYALANEALNRLAGVEATRRGGACVVRSIGWGPWEGGMVTPALARQFTARGIALIPLEGGAQRFLDEIAGSPSGRVDVVIGASLVEPTHDTPVLAHDTTDPSVPPRNERAGRVATPPRTLTRRVHARDYPFLRDHTIADTPVFPVVLALEWFVEIARELRSDARVVVCRDLRVLKGIVLSRLETDGDLVEVHATETGPDRLAMEIRSLTGTPHYRATIEYTDQPAPAPAPPPFGRLAKYPHTPEQIYAHLLFHGPDFQVIRNVRGVSDTEMDADLDSIADAGWNTRTWATDMAALDGGLQMVLLWTRHRTHSASLPTGIAAWRGYGRPAPGPVRCLLNGRKVGPNNTVSDLAFVDAGGRVYAELIGVEAHVLPGGQFPTRPVATAK